MLMKTALVALMGLSAIADATILSVNNSPMGMRLEARQQRGKNNNNNNAGKNNNNNAGKNNNNAGKNNAAAGGNNNAGGGGGGTCLQDNLIQKASQATGQAGGTPEAGQVNSKTDNANFINFCNGKTITNGAQIRTGSCNGIVMGNIPAANKMVSTVILNPKNGDTVPAGQDFNIQVKIANMALGSFTNAQNTYYTAPQDLQDGNIIGHTHITVQDLGNNPNPTTPLNAEQFVFFKGVNDAGDGNGGLQAAVAGGLPAGNYRLCTMAAAANHQPVLMPVAQRGSPDDCVRFTVAGGGGGGNNNNANAGKNNANAGKNNAAAGKDNANAGKNNAAAGKNNANANAGKNNAGKNNAAAAKNNQAVGAASAPAVEDSGDSTRPFRVNGDTFVNRAAAVQRSCSIQNNACADAVNNGGTGTLDACRQQEQACNANA